jgi:ribonuclease D
MSAAFKQFPLVDDSATLQEVMRHLDGAESIAIDTEFVRERTYYAQLCVLQIATDGMIAAIDCLADIELDVLFAELAQAQTTWVLHSARQDLEVLIPRTGRLPARLIDTQIAAAMLGFPLQVGLQALLSETLGIGIGKEHTRIDWSRRPLASEAIAYALDDVRYLMPGWEALKARLDSSGRGEWFTQDCARQLALPLLPSADAILDRTRGAGRLDASKRGAAHALVQWREERARQRDKPRRWILADDQLVSIAAAMPATLQDLKQITGLPGSLAERSGTAILSAIANAEPLPPLREPASPDKQMLRTLQERVRVLAEKLNVQPELLATRRDLSLVAAGQMPEVFATGWRAAILGELIREVSADRAC